MLTTPLLSWDFIVTGACHWDDHGHRIPCDTPTGVELRVEPATRAPGGAFLREDQPWEIGRIGWAHVMRDGELHRLWYGLAAKDGSPAALAYAESDDGHVWRKPGLGIHPHDGSTANNLVVQAAGANHMHVFRDPTAPDDARYRAWRFNSYWLGDDDTLIDNEEGLRRLNHNNATTDPAAKLPVQLKGSMFGHHSADGIHWHDDGMILDEWHDTHNVCTWDARAGQYRGYLRGFYGGRRAIAYAATSDFLHWPSTRVIHHHLPADGPADSLYSPGFTTYPGRPDIRLMFPSIYHQDTDRVDGQFAVSLDGVNWARHAGQTIIPLVSEEEGNVYPAPDLLRFPKENCFRLPVRANDVWHNMNYNLGHYAGRDRGGIGWAEWPEDRLAGIHAPADGSFTLAGQTCGDRLLVNLRTEPGGWARFELVDRIVWPPLPLPGLAGHTFAESDPIVGDHTHAPVTWNGSPELGPLAGRTVHLRVRLHKATLFAVTMYGADDPAIANDPRFPV